MTGTPTWQAATSGSAPLAAHVNQLLGTHFSQELYAAVQTDGHTTAGAGSTSTNGLWLAQAFTTAGGQTTVGYVIVNITDNTGSGTNLSPMTLSIYANSAGAPTGSALASTTVTAEYISQAPSPAIVPIPVTGLTASTQYWLVVPAVGNGSFNYQWNKSNQVSGASTSTNGSTWTAQAYGFRYQIFDQSASGRLTSTWEDSGARWTAATYTGNGTLSTLAEYTAGQTAAGYLQSVRSLSYSSGLVTGVS